MQAPSIAIALFAGVEELDWVGPWEVPSGWALNWPDDRVTVFTVADTTSVVTCAQGARVLASLCTGSLVLADPGVLDNRPATTYRASLDHLRSLATGIDVRRFIRYDPEPPV